MEEARYWPLLSSGVPVKRDDKSTATLSVQIVVGAQAPLMSFEKAIVTVGPEQSRSARVLVAVFVGRADAREAMRRAMVLVVIANDFMLKGCLG